MRVVCVNVGSKYADVYVERMYLMCKRHIPQLERFTCFTDRRRQTSSQVEQIDCSSWGLTGWWAKLKLFDREVLDEPFLFLDLDQIILRPLNPLLKHVESRPEPSIIGMEDFLYKTFSSNIMMVRPDEVTQGIWDAYAAGKRFTAKGRKSGDQDFIEGYATDRGISNVLAKFPSEWFVSYKVLRKVTRGNSRCANEALNNALFLVFHGRPMPHEVLDPVRSLAYLLRHKPLRALTYWRFLEREVCDWWCLERDALALK